MRPPRARAAQLTPELVRALRNPVPPPVSVVLHTTPAEGAEHHERVRRAIGWASSPDRPRVRVGWGAPS
jgi:hypothetical protein